MPLDILFLHGLFAGLAIACVGPIIGMFLTVKRQSLIADTLAHASLSGVALGLLLGVSPILGAVLCALFAAIVIDRLKKRGGIFSGDAPLAVVMAGGLALATVVLSSRGDMDAEALEFLFGDIHTVSAVGLMAIMSVALLVLLFLFFTFRKLFLIAFDEDIARAQGIKVDAYNLGLTIATALLVAVGMQVVGVLLMGALMVIPVLAASEWGKGFRTTTFIAVVFSLISMAAGFALANAFHVAEGGTVVLLAIGFFILSLLAKGIRSQAG